MGQRLESRDLAIAAGARTYETGVPCLRGHIAPRLVDSWQCTECRRLRKPKDTEEWRERRHATVLKWASKNKEAINKQNRKWRTLNPEKFAESMRKSRVKHAAANRENVRNWQMANPEKVRLYSNRHRVRKIQAEGSHTLSDQMKIRKAQRDRCAYCRVRLHGSGHLDHIVALSRGGSDYPSNLQWLCVLCNCRKSAKDPVSFANELGLLV